jgi:hypothetical protein
MHLSAENAFPISYLTEGGTTITAPLVNSIRRAFSGSSAMTAITTDVSTTILISNVILQ